MKRKKLGNSNFTISAIGLGGMPLSLSSRPPESQSIAVIHRALDLGVTLIDTADSYCQDESDKHHNEQLIAKALEQYTGDTRAVTVATKGGLMRPQGAWTRNGNPHHLRQTIRESFEALGGQKPIDLWQYHSPDPAYTIEAALAPAKEAVEAGMIRFIGVSNFSVEQIKRARDTVEVVSVQNQYNPWHRQPESDGVSGILRNRKTDIFSLESFGRKPPRHQLRRYARDRQISRRKKRFSLLYSISLVDGSIALRRSDSRCDQSIEY